MKNGSILLISFLVSIFISFSINADIISDSSLDISTTYVQNYMWRGFDLLPNNDPAIQPDVYFSLGNTGVYLGIWGSFAPDSKWDIWDEWDFYGGYNFTVAENSKYELNIDAGYTYFHFPNQNKDIDSQQISLAFQLTNLLEIFSNKLEPYLTMYYGFAAHSHADDSKQEAFWVKLGAAYSVPVKEQDVNFYLETYYNDGAGTAEVESGISHIACGIDTVFQIAKLSIQPRLNYQWTLEDTVNDEDEVWVEVKASISI